MKYPSSEWSVDVDKAANKAMRYLSSLTPRLTVILCSVLVNYVSGVTVKEMFPFGPEAGDIELLWGDYAWRWISLRTPVTTFGTLTTHVQVIAVVISG